MSRHPLLELNYERRVLLIHSQYHNPTPTLMLAPHALLASTPLPTVLLV
jgi:hypothetical protein